MPRRLFLQIYFALLGVIAMFLLLAGAAWRLVPPDARPHEHLRGASALVSQWLPSAEQPVQQQQVALEQLARWFNVDLILLAPNGAVVARTDGARTAEATHRQGPQMMLKLNDGRLLAAHWQHARWPKRLLVALILLAGAVAAAAYPVARRISRRVETLQHQVDALGKGELSARVDVRGNDEIAQLARSFNRSAEQIEKLVNAQRSTLAAASHELRSPLARMRMGIELLDNGRADVRERLSADIAELDALVGEVLLASRLQTVDRIERTEQVDLLGLLAEEGARVDAEVSGASATIQGDARMLRRLVRNLLENAKRYGGDSKIDATVSILPSGTIKLTVADRGPGIPATERDRVFEPFYRLPGTAEQGSGVGLGLALVRQIARHHGGDALCLAREGGGTRFEVTLN